MEMPEGIWTFTLLCVTSLVAIINPLSTAPLYLSITRDYTPEHQHRTLQVAVLTGTLVLIVFALLGGAIFQLFGITIDAFRIAGGLIIFGIGTDMLQAKRSRGKATPEEERAGMEQEDVGITPLGVPMLVGPGSITTVMVLMSSAESLVHVIALLVVVVLVLATIYFALLASPRLVRLLGKAGLSVATRIMGLLLTVIAVQFVVDGARPILVEVLRSASAPE